ncbi:hypothetical protein LMG23992_01021 [Cupriavidus laharis]|uniref:Uncharacterized protein n=1 Tax=Cupriavidus laharis TaxID=151654 RepID=A0ABN7Y416_9BURK|nr:hypothetical protein LMG23992_01021 [Cupriavidus laharis]
MRLKYGAVAAALMPGGAHAQAGFGVTLRRVVSQVGTGNCYETFGLAVRLPSHP